jgi:hypothetical protein
MRSCRLEVMRAVVKGKRETGQIRGQEGGERLL